MKHFPRAVRIVEVGPRDGLQNEPAPVTTEVKLGLIGRLVEAGLTTIEATAFVAPKWVPQMADAAAVMAGLPQRDGLRFPVLVPNLKGLEAALAAGAREVAVFAAASESFSQRNINGSIAESLTRFVPVARAAREAGAGLRGYVSCVLGCPYEGAIAPAAVGEVVAQLFDLGCHEVSLGDTIGAGTAASTARLLEALLARFSAERLAGHFHDTYGQALANVLTALDHGIATFDASVGGLGGCPYAKGATGNLATEDLVYLLDGLGIASGVALDRLVDAADYIYGVLGRPPAGRVARALLAQRTPA